MYFSFLFGIVSAEARALFASLYTPLDCSVEPVFDEDEDNHL